MYRPDGFRSYALVHTFACGTSLAAALRIAESSLAPHAVERTAHGSREPMWFADLLCDGKVIDTCEPDIRIVPSVGELGWTP